ncbi:hypothetical protein ERO13_D01G150101v2 [Gossypium hirsutum]|uniref:Uncharacterized protein n=1 Tax=Gossypium mustelinum TaxID=34275 RepID=A0A5D2W940_GOSMU|nr:hypothetical protein ERO13_D01G150101v2 [Gossypium hirsutum]TYI98068.1 hypothetical protein E1A91_D01G186100v1 [Gossypium mustelinum]
MDTDRERHRDKETSNTICFIMHKSSGNKTHRMKKKINSPAEEQITSRGRKNQHQQKNKEPAPAEDQRSSR